jgi:hypothetical protein
MTLIIYVGGSYFCNDFVDVPELADDWADSGDCGYGESYRCRILIMSPFLYVISE